MSHTLDKKPRPYEKGNGRFNACYSTYRALASGRGIIWELTKEEFDGLSQGDCLYCGTPPVKIFAETRIASKKWGTRDKYKDIYIYNGIDRLNPNLGYVIDNCVSCCKVCNRAKSDMLYEDFQEWIEKLLKNYRR